jgi:hypothetical protein
LKPFDLLQKYNLAISNPALETCVHYQTGGAGDNPSFLSVTLANVVFVVVLPSMTILV